MHSLYAVRVILKSYVSNLATNQTQILNQRIMYFAFFLSIGDAGQIFIVLVYSQLITVYPYDSFAKPGAVC